MITRHIQTSAAAADSPDIELTDTLAALNAAELDAIDTRRRQVLATPKGLPPPEQRANSNCRALGLRCRVAAQPGVIELWLPPTDSISADKVSERDSSVNLAKY